MLTLLAGALLGFGLGAWIVYELVLRLGRMRREILRLRKQLPARGDRGRFVGGGRG